MYAARPKCVVPIFVTSFIGRLRLFACLAGLRDDACQNVERLGACFGIEFLAQRLLRRRGRFEKGQGQLHGNSPPWPRALGAESSGGSGERRRSPLRGANRPVRRDRGRAVRNVTQTAHEQRRLLPNWSNSPE